jgi:GT2 family glycosyltransferase
MTTANTQKLPEVLISQVHFNSLTTHGEQCIRKSIDAARSQLGFNTGRNLKLLFIDNASSDGTSELLRSIVGDGEELISLPENIGFCGGHNVGAYQFLKSTAQYYLALNPDLKMAPTCLSELVKVLSAEESAGTACPLLLRGDENLDQLQPRIVDAAGMILTSSLRHFDIDSELPFDESKYAKKGVFGGSGACLLLSRGFVSSASFRAECDRDVFKVFPQLKAGYSERCPLFDEAFFAYREDAELAWRGQLLGYKCWFVPEAVAVHRRVVTPEKRGELSPFINMLGVQNRFLLQGNCFFVGDSWKAFFLGGLMRNLIVLLATVLIERTSIRGLGNVFRLRRRMFARRTMLRLKRKPEVKVFRI